MKYIALLVYTLYWGVHSVHAWGHFAHKKINELAVFTLPPEMFLFYKKNIAYLYDHAADPDKRRYLIPEEGPRHFIDLDKYEQSMPVDTLPHDWEEAVNLYSEDTLIEHGIGPWYLELMVKKLTYAFKTRDLFRIIKLSNDLGHYAADLNVPLHTTSNYNGQKTQQHGIHALWESRLPELFAGDYDFWFEPATYVENPRALIWKHVSHAHSLVDSVLKVERKVAQSFKPELIYSYEERGKQTVRVYSRAFSKAYHQALGNMVEEQMRQSVQLVGALWFTAWVNAGQPELQEEAIQVVVPDDERELKKEVEKQYQEGTILGRPEPNE